MAFWNKMIKKIFPRDANYYFGLLFLVVASFSIAWCYFRDSFEPMDFILFFLFYCAGFALLWKSDTTIRIRTLLDEIDYLKRKAEAMEEDMDFLYHDLEVYSVNQRALRRRGMIY